MTPNRQRTGLPLILMGLLLLVLLPALLYSAYELATLSESEALVAEVYRRQLDGILFSLNQYSWDVANGWASSVNGAIAEHVGSPPEALTRQLAFTIERSAGLNAVILCDTLGTRRRYVSPDILRTAEIADAALLAGRPLLGRLVELRRMEYRKLEPLPRSPGKTTGRDILIAFATGSRRPEEAIGVLLFNDSLFVQEILGPRIREAAGSDFLNCMKSLIWRSVTWRPGNESVLRNGKPTLHPAPRPADRPFFRHARGCWRNYGRASLSLRRPSTPAILILIDAGLSR